MTIGSGSAVDVGGLTTIHRQGLLKLDGGTLATSELRFDFTGGQFQWTSGTLHVGRYNGNLTNSAGVLAPGESAGSTTITGTYTQQAAATLEIEIGGIAPTTQHDDVTVQNSVALGGQLQLALINSFVPGQQTFSLCLAHPETSPAHSPTSPTASGLATSDGTGSFLVHYGAGSAFNPRQIVLTNFQSSTLAGDFNRDGSVDAADYVVWRRNPSGNTFVDNSQLSNMACQFRTHCRAARRVNKRAGARSTRADLHAADRRTVLYTDSPELISQRAGASPPPAAKSLRSAFHSCRT